LRAILLALAAGAAAALLGLRWTGSTEADLGPGRVELTAGLGRGQTTVGLPPLGRIRAETHPVPLALGVRVVAVDVEAAQRTISGGDRGAPRRPAVPRDRRGVCRRFARQVLLFAAGTGAVAALLLPGRGWWPALPGAVGGVAAVGVLFLAAWGPYDIDAF